MVIALLFHITVALAGVATGTIAFFKPTKLMIRATYSLIGLTVLSGSYLVVRSHSAILSSCLAGLVYVGLVSSAALAGHRKLARQEERYDQ